jgi:hypothetical protein
MGGGREGEVKGLCTVTVIEKEGSPVIVAAVAHAPGQPDSHFEHTGPRLMG